MSFSGPAFSLTPEDAAPQTHAKSMINLLRGWPNPSLLPVPQLSTATTSVLSEKPSWAPALLYGPDAGAPRLRTALSTWLTGFYRPKEKITEERIVITGGASQNLGCLLQVFSDPVYTRHAWMVAPAYMLAFRIFADSGFGVAGRMRAVPEDEEGIDLTFLRREMEKAEAKAEKEGNTEPRIKPQRDWNKIYKHIIYCVPTFANPSSKTMSLHHRQELVRLAREFDALVICDDVYDMLQWPADLSTDAEHSALKTAIMPRVVDIDRTLEGGTSRTGADGFGNVVSNASFSKIGGPGLRVGWVESTPKFVHGVSQTGTTASGGAPSQFTSTAVADLMESGELQKHIHGTLQPTYASRYRTLAGAIKKYLVPLGVTLPQEGRDTVGGYFLWFTLPEPLLGAEVARRVKEDENVIIANGEMFEVPGDQDAARFERSIRVCFSWEEENKMEEGIKRVADVVTKMLEEAKSSNGKAANGEHKKANGIKDDEMSKYT